MDLMAGCRSWCISGRQEIWTQALPLVDDSRQLQQEPQALQAQRTEHDSLQDLTGFCE